MSAVEGFGTVLEYGDQSTYSGSTTWTAVAQIEDVEPPTHEVDKIDTTHHGVSSKWRTFIGGLKDGGSAKLTVQYVKTQHSALDALVGVSKGWRISLNDTGGTNPSRFGFDGFIESIGPKTPIDGIDTVELQIKASGVPVFVAAA